MCTLIRSKFSIFMNGENVFFRTSVGQVYLGCLSEI